MHLVHVMCAKHAQFHQPLGFTVVIYVTMKNSAALHRMAAQIQQLLIFKMVAVFFNSQKCSNSTSDGVQSGYIVIE